MIDDIQPQHLHVSAQGYTCVYRTDYVLKLCPQLQPARREIEMMLAAADCSVPVVGEVISPNGGGGFLMPRLRPIVPSQLSAEQKEGLMTRIAALLYTLHSRGIVHGDVKLANILLTPEGTVKFCDFYTAVRMTEQIPPTAMSIRWCRRSRLVHRSLAPMNVLDDIYALGWVVWELFTGFPPFAEIQDQNQVIETISAGNMPDLNRVPHEGARTLIQYCWSRG
jgi:serine/threonine protein kinase